MKKIISNFGDDCEISFPATIIDCGTLGHFDSSEEACWKLCKKYLEFFGIKRINSEVSFDIAKGIQDYILRNLWFSGVRFYFGEDDLNEEKYLYIIKNLDNEDFVAKNNIKVFRLLDEAFYQILPPWIAVSDISEYVDSDAMLKVLFEKHYNEFIFKDGNIYYGNFTEIKEEN